MAAEFMSQPPEIPWIEAADTPWGVPVLEVQFTGIVKCCLRAMPKLSKMTILRIA
jgi:hypothetical protein